MIVGNVFVTNNKYYLYRCKYCYIYYVVCEACLQRMEI